MHTTLIKLRLPMIFLVCCGGQLSSARQKPDVAAHVEKAKPSTHGPLRLCGQLIPGGAECQRFRSSEGRLYTLEGDLRGFRIGDTVEITGVPAQASHCMQDIPITVKTIRRSKCPSGARKKKQE